MYNSIMCPYAYLLAGFMWFVKNGGKALANPISFFNKSNKKNLQNTNK